MNTETITAQFVDPPKPGKKLANVKTADGRRFGFDPSKVSLQPGGTYTVQTSSREWQGKTYLNIEAVVGAPPAAAQSAPRASGSNGYAKPTDDATAERIYCCGIVNAAISSGSLTLSTASLVAATNAARQAWAQTFGGKAQSYDDEPPVNEDSRGAPF